MKALLLVLSALVVIGCGRTTHIHQYPAKAQEPMSSAGTGYQEKETPPCPNVDIPRNGKFVTQDEYDRLKENAKNCPVCKSKLEQVRSRFRD